jgi:hypothetical protein
MIVRDFSMNTHLPGKAGILILDYMPCGPTRRSAAGHPCYAPVKGLHTMVQIHTEPGESARETIKLTIDDAELDFNTARARAKTKALEISRNAMQLAWFNGQTGRGFPDYDCGPGDRPPWQVFADSRGANLTIDINDGTFIFIYLTM